MSSCQPFNSQTEIARLERRIADLEAQVRLLTGTAWPRPAAPAPAPVSAWPPILPKTWQSERDDWYRKAIAALPPAPPPVWPSNPCPIPGLG